MELQLQHKLALKQILTPQLVQTMELIQLPILELSQKLKQELNENPMLETKEDRLSEEIVNNDNNEIDQMDLAEYKKLFKGLQRLDANMQNRPYDEEDEVSPFDLVAYQTSIYETLNKQISLINAEPKIRELAEFIVGNLQNDGMLKISLEELMESAKEQNIVEEPHLEEMQEALDKVQSLEPVGVGSRNIRECYLIQLENATKFDALAYEIVRDHFDMLGSKNLPQMQKILQEPMDKIKDSLHTIYHLKTHPVSESDDKFSSSTVEPDIVVRKVDGKWQVIYNNFDIPALRISRYYMTLLKKNKKLKSDIKEFLKKKLDSAKWWIDALMLRQQNMENTMETIIESQIDFFEKGPNFIKPMKMEDIANKIGVHPATISRIAKDKYVQTPHGIFPMKYFFTRGLSTDSGEDMSTRVIKEKLRDCIEKENKAKPFSDQKIADILTADGIKIARRTVAKYREQLGYPSARMRKLK
ncbi:MAG: RNA polymerase factor sigma-54 [Candidatus Zixiibacteriota bacterium]